MSLKELCPWQVKFHIKKFTSKHKALKNILRQLGIFKHGEGENPDYSYSIFQKHYQRVKKIIPNENFVCLEIGPGGYFSSSVISHLLGSKKTYMVDVEEINPNAIKSYPILLDFLKDKGLNTDEIKNLSNSHEILNAVQGVYYSKGIHSLSDIPDSSIDFIWSNACLEHIYIENFKDLISETKRILRGNGVCSHTIDLQDHLGYSLNNLRFSPEYWESDDIKQSGFYTNRIRYKEMIRIFEQIGFKVDIVETKRWDELPIDIQKLDPYFSKNKDEDLSVATFDVLLTTE